MFKLHQLDGNVSATAKEFTVSRRVVERCRNSEDKIRSLVRERNNSTEMAAFGWNCS